jgi:hypothetical protein
MRAYHPLVVALALLATRPAGAQQSSSLAARVAAAAADATVEMRFPVRPGVCGDGRSFVAIGRSTIRSDSYTTSRVRENLGPCEPGPARVVLTLAGHDVVRAHTYVGGGSSSAVGSRDAVDLGAVDPRDAAAYLLDLAAKRGTGRIADEAILGAVVADRAIVWPGLLAIVRDSGDGGPSRGVRSTAAFWLSRFATAARDGHPERIDVNADSSSNDGDDERDVRGQAVFALSQLPRHEGVPSLIEVARTHHDPALRAKAMFWLGQSGDPRAIDLFEEILRKAGSPR